MYPERVRGGWRLEGIINGRYINEYVTLEVAPTREAILEYRKYNYGI